ncbi:unnamed protein product, partial [Ascophyllum nodosum]
SPPRVKPSPSPSCAPAPSPSPSSGYPPPSPGGASDEDLISVRSGDNGSELATEPPLAEKGRFSRDGSELRPNSLETTLNSDSLETCTGWKEKTAITALDPSRATSQPHIDPDPLSAASDAGCDVASEG